MNAISLTLCSVLLMVLACERPEPNPGTYMHALQDSDDSSPALAARTVPRIEAEKETALVKNKT